MRYAITLAQQAADQHEVPVGAIIVYQDQIIGRGHNSPISDCNPVAHAEINAIKQAAYTIKNYRLVDATLYATLEPCLMCAGAIVHARIKRLVYGADDPKAGAIQSQFNILHAAALNHRVEIRRGVLAAECAALLQSFFKARR